MKLEAPVLSLDIISLELSKRLKELDINHQSLYSYFLSEFQIIKGKVSEKNIVLTYSCISNTSNKWNAYTASELFEILPYFIDTKNNEPFNFFRFNMTRGLIVEDNKDINNPTIVFSVNYNCDIIQLKKESPYFALNLIKHNIYDASLSNCLAKLLIYLLEEGFVKIEEIK
jgi:hypothetical protein